MHKTRSNYCVLLALLFDYIKPTESVQNKTGAVVRDRTGDLVLTKNVLCQLSYNGLRTILH